LTEKGVEALGHMEESYDMSLYKFLNDSNKSKPTLKVILLLIRIVWFKAINICKNV